MAIFDNHLPKSAFFIGLSFFFTCPSMRFHTRFCFFVCPCTDFLFASAFYSPAQVRSFYFPSTVCYRRGVRSDAQLRSTETRFQKCSQSGKNGSKHPMLSISMAFNVISCKKVERNTQKLKIADFTM